MNRNWTTLIITMVGALNTAAIAFGVYHLSNEQLDAVDKIVSVGAMILGVALSHNSVDKA